MKLSEIPERVRTFLLQRIHRGELTITLLARQTGLSKSHISKFLHGGKLSMEAFHRIGEALDLNVEDVLGPDAKTEPRSKRAVVIPVVSHSAAIHEPEIRPHAVLTWLSVPQEDLPSRGPFTASWRLSWRRFIAIRIDQDEARSMGRPEYSGAIVVIDRHYNSLRLYNPKRSNLYAMHDGEQLVLRYLDRVDDHLVVRPANLSFQPKLIKVSESTRPGEYAAGRVAIIQFKT